MIVDLQNPDNFTFDTGFVSSTSSPRLTDTTLDISVDHIVNATYALEDFTGSPTDQWSFLLSLDGSVVTAPPSLSFTPSTTQLQISGVFRNSEVYPGDYSVFLSHQVTDSASSFNQTTFQQFSWLVNPLPLDMSESDGSTLAFVEIGTQGSFQIQRVGGFSTGPSGPAPFVDVSWIITNLSTSGPNFSSLSLSGDSPTFQVSFADDKDLVGAYSFDLTLRETCNSSAPSYCANLVSTLSRRMQIQAVGHNFNFSSVNRDVEVLQTASSFGDLSQFVPVYFGSNQIAKPDFSFYEFQAVNMKSSDFIPLQTADFQIDSFLYNGVPQGVSAGAASAGGLRLRTPSAGTARVSTLERIGALIPNDTFLITLSALSSSSVPPLTSITLGFIVLEGAAPTITQSSVLEAVTIATYTWPLGMSINAFPAETTALVSATLSEAVTGLQLRIDSGGTTGVPVEMSPPTTSSSFTQLLSSGALLSYLGTDPETTLVFTFAAALDQINRVHKNLLQDSITEFRFVKTPDIVSVGGLKLGTVPRSGSLLLEFSSPATGEVSTLKQGVGSGQIGDFSLSYTPGKTGALISPVGGVDLITSGTTLNLDISPGYLISENGIPNIFNQSFSIEFEEDDQPPVLLSLSQSNDSYLTNPSYQLLFDENLSGNVNVFVKNLTQESQIIFPFTPVGSSLNFSLPNLQLDSEYEIVLRNISDGLNQTELLLDSFLTLPDDQQTAQDLNERDQFLLNDTDPPTIISLSPDFFSSEFQENVSLRPLITLDFSEEMNSTTTLAFSLKTLPDNQAGPTLDFSSFDGVRLSLIPRGDLLPGVEYALEFNGFATDRSASSNPLTPVTITFRTYSPPAPGLPDPNTPPRYMGSNMRGVLGADDRLRVFFSEPVDVGSLEEAFVLQDKNGGVIRGSFHVDGSSGIFQPENILASGEYQFRLELSQVRDFLGKADSLGVQMLGSFKILSTDQIRRFQVHARSNSSTLEITGSWLAPENKSNIDSYELLAREISGFTPSGPEFSLGTLNLISGSVLRISGALSGFSPGDSYQLILRALNGSAVVTEAYQSFFSMASEVQTLESTYGNMAFPSRFCLGRVSLSASDVARICIPPGALRRSTLLSLLSVSDPLFEERKGGGKRYSPVIHLSAEGAEFLKPIEYSIRFEEPLGLDQVTPNCASLDSACADDLQKVLTPLVYSSAEDSWDGRGAIRSHVEILDSNTAVYHGKTYHFSSFLIAESLTILSPAAGADLASATIGQPYQDFIELSGDPSNETVDVSFNPTGYGFSVLLDKGLDRVEISKPQILRPPNDLSNSIDVTVRVEDFSTGLTDSRQFRIPIIDVGGDPLFSGIPRAVDSFPVFLVSSDTVDLSWSIASDTDQTIDQIIVEGTDLLTQEKILISMPRGVVATRVSIPPGSKYYWTIHTKSFLGERSSQSQDLERPTFGSAQNGLSGSGNSSSGSVSFTYSIPSGTVYVNPLDEGTLDVLSLQGTLVSTSELDPPDGLPIEFYPESGIDLNFSGVTDPNSVASFSYTLARTGSMRVYHYLQTQNSGGWEVLPSSSSGGHRLWATLQALGNNTRVTIFSRGGAGSPFAVGPTPLPDVIKAGGGGGCTVSEHHGNSSDLLNFFFLLFSLFICLYPGYSYKNESIDSDFD